MIEQRLWLKSSHDLTGKIFRINWLFVVLLCGLATIGYVALYSAAGGSPEPYATRHIVRFAFGLLLMVCIALVDIRIIARFSWVAYAVGVALLILVLKMGHVGKGAQRWLELGGQQIQPSELMKLGLILALAAWFHRASWERIGNPLFLIPPLLAVLVPVGLILKEPNLGTAMITMMLGGVLFFAAGVRWWKFALVLLPIPLAAHYAYQHLHGYHVTTRVFNDCPSSVLTVVNNYPVQINVLDQQLDCFGFANRHAWSFSADGGATPAAFVNGDQFSYCATLTMDGTGGGEGGLRLSPWYSLDVDGTFNCRTTDGEIACFGGRLPFYSFTDPAHGGLHYVKGTPIQLMIDYKPNGLSAASPATITYSLVYNSVPYSSGPLAFDQGNAAEDPPHGLWGILTPARVGGHAQFFLGNGTSVDMDANWANICYEASPTPANSTTWGKVKANYR